MSRIVMMSLLLSAIEASCVCDVGSSCTAAASPKLQSFAIYALSRGKGVPDEAKAVLVRAEGMLEGLRDRGADITITKKRLGLEGETRLCATFTDQSLAKEVMEHIQRFASGVDLVNLIEESCDTTTQQ